MILDEALSFYFLNNTNTHLSKEGDLKLCDIRLRIGDNIEYYFRIFKKISYKDMENYTRIKNKHHEIKQSRTIQKSYSEVILNRKKVVKTLRHRNLLNSFKKKLNLNGFILTLF
jgi:hypothetical protein